ncbi:MAG TPA: MHYT domain-containing protein [Ramlibacter sp.]|uniref:MHYT domain-containing protein n=1 Tax=Ramlibacter sp. TaxID=1917967 RepID=UPI002ED5F02E
MGDILQARHDMAVVFVSYVVSVLGSYAGLHHAQFMYGRGGKLNWAMVTGAAVALGGIGIWTMHFLGVMGYRLPLPVVYDGVLTVASLVAAIVIAGIALLLANRGGRFNRTGWMFGSVLAGLGVCVMHYMGMYAMNLRAEMRLDLLTVAASVAIAITAAAAALWLASHVRQTSHRIGAALVMGVAVCTMHYTGMAAADFICIAQQSTPDWSIGGDLIPMVFGVAGLVLVVLTWNLLGILGGNAKQGGTPAGARRA